MDLIGQLSSIQNHALDNNSTSLNLGQTEQVIMMHIYESILFCFILTSRLFDMTSVLIILSSKCKQGTVIYNSSLMQVYIDILFQSEKTYLQTLDFYQNLKILFYFFSNHKKVQVYMHAPDRCADDNFFYPLKSSFMKS